MPLFPDLLFVLKSLGRLGRFRWPNWPVIVLFLLRMPFLYAGALAEWLISGRSIRRTPIDRAPLFLLGHHRSGTTLLHKLLACDPQFGYIDTFDVFFPYSSRWIKRWTKPALQALFRRIKFKNPHFNDYLFQLDDPLEEDIYTLSAGTRHSAFWGDVFAGQRQEFSDRTIFFREPGSEQTWAEINARVVQKFTRASSGKRFLSKNPPNTGRVSALLRRFPEARFLYLVRNPYQVFYSTFQLWKRTIEPHYLLEKRTDDQIREIVFSYYAQLIDAYERQKSLIPPENLVEIRYEDLKNNPVETLRQVYAKLRLPGFERAEPHIRARLDAEKSYQTYPYDYDPALDAEIYARWSRYIDAGHYRPPSGHS